MKSNTGECTREMQREKQREVRITEKESQTDRVEEKEG